MREDLTPNQIKEYEKIRGQLRTIKELKSGIINLHGIDPSEERVKAYENAVTGLSKRMGELVDGIYEVSLQSLGNDYSTEVRIRDVNVDLDYVSTRFTRDFERTMNTIIDVMEDSGHTVEHMGRREIDDFKGILLMGGGNLECDDHLSFYYFYHTDYS